MSFRISFMSFLVLILALVLVVAGCSALGGEPRTRTELVTVVVIVTATPDPNATPNLMIITATPDRTQVSVPDGLVPPAGQTDTSLLNQLQITAIAQAQASSQQSGGNIPPGCIVHTIDTGDTVFGLAEEYGVNPFLMLQANGMSEDDAVGLQIGDTLIVPIEGCAVEEIVPPATATPEFIETEVTETTEATEALESPTPSVSPTLTLPPTATNAQVEIAGILSAGDVTAEGVRIRNTGSNIRITGWQLTDADGNEYIFGDQIIFSNSELTVYTRAGQDTPVARFWGLDEPIWQSGDIVTLRDTDGDVQAVFRVPGNVNLP